MESIAKRSRTSKSSLARTHAVADGAHSEALRFTRRARELDPLSALMPALSSQVAFQARDYRAALDYARQAINVLDPEFWIGHMMRNDRSATPPTLLLADVAASV